MKNIFEVGKEVYILNRSNGYNSPPSIETALVEKVGRKYVTVKRNWSVFEFELGHTENGVIKLPRKDDGYTHYMHLFLTKEDAEREQDRLMTVSNIDKKMHSFLLRRMSLEDLQKIDEILDRYV